MGHVAMKDGKALKQSQLFAEIRTMVPVRMAMVDPQYRKQATEATESLMDNAHANALYMENMDDESMVISKEFADLLEELTLNPSTPAPLVGKYAITLNRYNNLREKREALFVGISGIIRRVTPENLTINPREYVEQANLANMAFKLLRDQLDDHVVESLLLNKEIRAGITNMRELQGKNQEQA